MFRQISGILEKETKEEFLATSSDGSTVLRMNIASAVACLVRSRGGGGREGRVVRRRWVEVWLGEGGWVERRDW
jgi:hypothetical protein